MPDIVVMKFGGTSVADAERIKRAARRIVAKREAGFGVVAVLSARGKTTDELIAMAEEVSTAPDPREMDMLLSTGERISCALCAMAINDLGHRAISLTGSQAGIVTDTSHTKARILDVRADRVRAALEQDHIVLVAGFQGVSTADDVTTLGRGGSDTTAVAVAAGSSAPTPGSCPMRASSRSSPSRRCSRWLPLEQASCSCGRSSMRATRMSVFTAARPLTTVPVPSWCRKERTWRSPSSPLSRTRRPNR